MCYMQNYPEVSVSGWRGKHGFWEKTISLKKKYGKRKFTNVIEWNTYEAECKLS